MKYYEYVEKMKNVPYTESISMGLNMGWFSMLSRYHEWPHLVEDIDDTLKVVKVPLFHKNEKTGNYVRVIGFTPRAFRGRDQLTDIIVSKSRAAIASESFLDCKNLRRLTIPKAVTRIEENAFKGCANLEDVYYEGSMTEWDKIYIVSKKHEVEFGEFYPGTPVQKIKSERLVHIPGNEALLTATIHFNCNLEELIPPGPYEQVNELMKGKMSVSIEEYEQMMSSCELDFEF